MFLRFNSKGSRRADDGKFQRRARFGIETNTGGKHRGWSYKLISHQTGTSVKRTIYHAEILDPHDNQLAFLRDFSNLDQASRAAREWIDNRLNLVAKLRAAGSVGQIPPPPPTTKPSNQEK